MSTPSLRLEEVSIRKGGRTVVSGLDWRQEAGSVLWVVGRNGSGKTSLLRCLAGLDRPDDGRIVRRGGRGRGRVHYDPGMRLPPRVRAGAWLRLTCGIAGGDPESERMRARWAHPGKRVGQLSTGEQKRLVLEALLSRDAAFVLLDEPFDHLSLDGREALLALLARKRPGSVVVVATNRPPPAAPDDRTLRVGEDPPCSIRGVAGAEMAGTNAAGAIARGARAPGAEA